MKSPLVFALCLTALKIVHSTPLGVVNGDDVKPNSIPFQAHVYGVEPNGEWNFTGVLISKNYVLATMESFFGGFDALAVTLGAHDISKRESSQQRIVANTTQKWEVIYYNDFKYPSLENNIALIKLPTPAKLNAKVQAAHLTEKDNIVIGQKGFISGWGVKAYRLFESTLKSASVTIVDNQVCAKAYPARYTGPKTICTQGDKEASACINDDGAPLVIDGIVVGVYSAGPLHTSSLSKGCAGRPNIFIKVSSYIDWIKDNTDL